MSPSEHPSALARAAVPAPQKTATPAPGLARCPKTDVLTPEERAAGQARRAEADLVVRELVQLALRRTGSSAVARRLGVSRALAHGWGHEGGLAMSLRDVLAAPRSFARDVLEAALLAVTEEVPETLEAVEQLAKKLLFAATDLLRAIEDTRGLPEGVRRKVVLAIVDAIEDRCQQVRRWLNQPAPAAPAPPPSCPSVPNPNP